MSTKNAQSQYASGYSKVGYSLYVLIAGIICLFFNGPLGLSLVIIGIILFFVGTKQKRSLKNEMWEDALKKTEEEASE